MRGRVLIVAGSDSGGGAGIQADIKAVTALDGFAMTAVAALTAQNTLGVQAVLPIPPDFVRLQIDSVLDDLGADCFKTGMLADAATIEVVADCVRRRPDIPLVLDPVMVAKGGQTLLPDTALDSLRRHLVPRATLITPNLPEAAVLCGRRIESVSEMEDAAAALLDLGAPAVLLKGGHLPDAVLVDMLVTTDGILRMPAPRIETRHTHGTGCTLASAIATGLAQGLSLEAAIRRARAYVRLAIAQAPGFGAGAGPLNHAVTVSPFSG